MNVGMSGFVPGTGLPWGWWLRSSNGRLHDASGRTWGSIRNAFREGRLGMAGDHHARDQLELLFRVLDAMAVRWVGTRERQHDLFGGDMMFWRFYMCWLNSIGLLETEGGATALEGRLGEEGHAVLLMLRATRDPALVDLPASRLVEAVVHTRTSADVARETALREFERGITPLPHVFARESVGMSFLVTLTTLDVSDRMPVRRVVWSVAFREERARDDLFGWLAERVNRWGDWGDLVSHRGAPALTERLLGLLVVAPMTNPR